MTPEIRDAASVILLRDIAMTPKVLLGKRHSGAVFMPDKFAFPGGAVDEEDFGSEPVALPDECHLQKLRTRSDPSLTYPILYCAVREIWEETGLMLAEDGIANVPPGMESLLQSRFASQGLIPSMRGICFFFRAITPPYHPRRFDARFFLADLERVSVKGDPDRFDGASGELTDLRWVTFREAEQLDVPSITRLVLKRVEEIICETQDLPIPFHFMSEGKHRLEYL